MKTETILKLVDAGFSKEEILKMDSPAPIVPDQKQPEPKKEDPAPDPQPKTETVPAQPTGVTMSDDQFRTLLQHLNIQGATLDVPPEVDLSEKLADHFKDLMIGK